MVKSPAKYLPKNLANMAHLHRSQISHLLLPPNKTKNNCIKKQTHKLNAKSASEIGHVNNP
jgi:hypothetical protein